MLIKKKLAGYKLKIYLKKQFKYINNYFFEF